MRITRAVIPNFFTVLNMFCGLNAIISAHNNQFENAAWFIIFGGFFDAFDGFMARLTNSASEFGVELDSLSDLVTFGVAPSFLVYQLGLKDIETFGILISSLLMIGGGLRLARFNVQLVGFDKDYFNGLPIPGQAVFVCALVLTQMKHPDLNFFNLIEALPYIVIFLSLLMVSHVKYDTLPKFSKRAIKKEPAKFAVFVLLILGIVIFREVGLLVGLSFYLVYGLIRYGYRGIFGTRKPEPIQKPLS
ncbi:MAG: CDP-diacylglycerol--serine O-phosphatidyltransferase [Bacteroidetes bacterium]|nr:CDP-diacylglycerol--serine O-phosphatidyltransferase [Bacteroidota bacterium]